MIKKFCNKALILSHGELKYFGSVQEAIDIYESE
jgi:ABC-type polysaccharide/polyol phosphate transport system ATPase subunit